MIMYFNRLNKAQKEEYLRIVVLGEGFENYDIYGISCDSLDDFGTASNPLYSLSYVLEDKIEDKGPTTCEQEVYDYQRDVEHLRFMISKFGIDYLNSLKTYAKTPEGKKEFELSDIKQCERFLEKTMIEDRKVVGLDRYFEDCEIPADGNASEYDLEMER